MQRPRLAVHCRRRQSNQVAIVAMLSGPRGLRAIKGFRDEALSGDWKRYRSSRLDEPWRVIYPVLADALLVRVVRVTPHDYWRT